MGVLSIQSHVASGFVGNAAAVFALQRLGHEVWPIHTLLFSNHPGHGDVGGGLLKPALLDDILEGLERRGILSRCDAVLSGYLGSAEVGSLVLKSVALARAVRPDCLFVLDPVIGDRETGVFVADTVVSVIRDELTKQADVVTPNVFELEVLTNSPVDSDVMLLRAVHELRALGPGQVVVTGIDRGIDQIGTLLADADGVWLVETPRLDLGRRPNGAGDFFTACLVAHLLETKNAVTAMECAAACVHAALTATISSGLCEIDLVDSQSLWARPTTQFSARRFD